MHPAKLIKRIKFCFFERLNKKARWGKTEIKHEFEISVTEALEKYLEEMEQRNAKSN